MIRHDPIIASPVTKAKAAEASASLNSTLIIAVLASTRCSHWPANAIAFKSESREESEDGGKMASGRLGETLIRCMRTRAKRA